MLRMQEDRRDRALRASLDWVLTAVLIAVLRTPTLLTPNRLLVCRGTAACSPDLGLDICIHMCSSMHHYMRTQLYIARQTAHMYVQHAAVAQQHCSTTCICSS